MGTNEEILSTYYQQIKKNILDRQHPVTGLLPASTAISRHGNYTDAWVRDNVYSIMAVWALSLACRRQRVMKPIEYETAQSARRLMRGLLRAMMQQADKVERFKSSLALHDALHAKYDTATGQVVVGDHEWGHLQIDATSLFLLMVAQMTASGLEIIASKTEVDFIQNLVYYIERAHRTPDYGIWERGEKSNIGYVELNSSSIGMALAAMRALADLNLFGRYGDPGSRVHVMPDNRALAEITLNNLLPGESVTKEIDSAILSIAGFPAFAVTDQKKRDQVYKLIRTKLAGRYGYKRFLRDGHQTVLEDPKRHYYDEEELRLFQNIECEWPLFLTFELVTALFEGDGAAATRFRQQLEAVAVDVDGEPLLPELYIVPKEAIEEEKARPGSQEREPNDNLPLVWAQSLYYVGGLLHDGLLTCDDIDPIGLHRTKLPAKPVIQVVILAENEAMKQRLEQWGMASEVLSELPTNIKVCRPESIAAMYHQLGKNAALGLSGRPIRRLKSLTTSRLYQVNGLTYLPLPLFFLEKEFYLTFDTRFLIERLHDELVYIARQWMFAERPTVTLLFTEGIAAGEGELYRELWHGLQGGKLDKIAVALSRVAQLKTQARIEDMHELVGFDQATHDHASYRTTAKYLPAIANESAVSAEKAQEIESLQDTDYIVAQLKACDCLSEQSKWLENLVRRHGKAYKLAWHDGDPVSLTTLLEELYQEGGIRHQWDVVRLAAALLEKTEIDLQFAMSSMLSYHKIIQVGKAFSDDSLVTRPIPFQELIEKINRYCRDDIRDRVLTQEVLVFLGIIIRSEPQIFDDITTVRVSYIILLMLGELSRKHKVPQDEAYEILQAQSPSAILALLKQIMVRYSRAGQAVLEIETMAYRRKANDPLRWTDDHQLTNGADDEDWMVWRQTKGTLLQLPTAFYARAWQLLERSTGIVIGDKLDRRNRVESRVVLSDMTSGEKAFELRIEYLLSKIQAPEYRQLTIEALEAAASFAQQNPGLEIDDYLVFDVINGHAVRLAYLKAFPEMHHEYHDHKADAWTYFYQQSPRSVHHFFGQAMLFLLQRDGVAA